MGTNDENADGPNEESERVALQRTNAVERQEMFLYQPTRRWTYKLLLQSCTVCSFSPVKQYLFTPWSRNISVNLNVQHFFILFRSF